MKKFYKGLLAGALAAAMLFAPADAAFAKTVAAADSGEQDEVFYTVSFNANKGKKVKKTLTLSHLDAYGTLPKTSREGYKFKGWYTKKTGGVKVTAKSVFSEEADQVLYAHWKKLVSEEPSTAEAPAVEPEKPATEPEAPAAEPETPISSTALVSYTVNAETDYKKNDYSGFFVLKNFKPEYLYCQYDYDRFIGSSGKNVGCTATADAMLASIYTDQAFSPNDEGWISGVGATWTNSVVADGSKKYTVKQQCQAVYDYLNDGKPVLIRVIGHSVTAIGLRKGVDRDLITPSDILIADPADAKVKCADEMGYRVMTDANGWGLRIPKAALAAK